MLETVRQRGLLATGGLFVLESAKRDAIAMSADWQLHREAVYGDTRVCYLTLVIPTTPAVPEPGSISTS